LTLADQHLRLLACPAALWVQQRTLLVSDLHLGKDHAFRAHGLAVPHGVTGRTLDRLSAAIDAHAPERLVILGDLLHSRAGTTGDTLDALARWRRAHAELDVLLVRGNHDLAAGDPPASLGLEVVPEPASLAPFTLSHDPDAAEPSGAVPRPAMAGHIHPAVRLRSRPGAAAGSCHAPCFWLRGRTLILPAFGGFTGTHRVRPAPGDRVFAVGPDAVAEDRLSVG